MSLVATLFLAFTLGTFFPVFGLCIWQLFTDANSPYPLLGSLVAYNVVNLMLQNTVQKFMLKHMPLEFYHMPRWIHQYVRPRAEHNVPPAITVIHRPSNTSGRLISQVRHTLPWLRHLVAEDVLRSAAEARAARLRAQMGFTGDNAETRAGLNTLQAESK